MEASPRFLAGCSMGAIKGCNWRNELYEGWNRFYMGQNALEVPTGHSVKDLQQVIVQKTAKYMGSEAQGKDLGQKYRLESH